MVARVMRPPSKDKSTSRLGRLFRRPRAMPPVACTRFESAGTRFRQGQAVSYSLYASIGMTILTSSLLELGIPAFMPHSERLMVVVASPPHIAFLLKGLSAHAKLATLSETGLGTPIMVSSPSAPSTLSPSKITLYELHVIVVYFAAVNEKMSFMVTV